MAYFQYFDNNVYYDVTGKGNPILILNGIMMSTRSWEPFISTLSHKNMVIRVDFLDQGQTDKLKGDDYSQAIQVDMLHELLVHLGIKKINVVGISYGGEVALLFAAKYQKMIKRLVLFNTTSNTGDWLTDIGRLWINIGKTRDADSYYKATIPVIYSPKFYQKRIDWMREREEKLRPLFSNPEFLDAMERLTKSAERFDAREWLSKIKTETLIVSSDEDYLTPTPNQRFLQEKMPNSHLVVLPGVGHASMYEEPLLFVTLVLGFINSKETKYII